MQTYHVFYGESVENHCAAAIVRLALHTMGEKEVNMYPPAFKEKDGSTPTHAERINQKVNPSIGSGQGILVGTYSHNKNLHTGIFIED